MAERKRPEDYPQFNFRVPSIEDKEQLQDLILEAQQFLNSKLSESEKKICKNDVVARALYIGLNRIMSRKK